MDFSCDEIVCINLVERADKRLLFDDMMRKQGISFTYFDAIRDKKIPSRGCFMSHAKVISDAYEKGVKRLMIFEDDSVILENIENSVILQINSFLDDEKWEIFSLSGTPFIWNSTIKKHPKYENIYKGNYTNASAYILNTCAIEKYSKLKWEFGTKIIDKDVYMKNQNAYCIFPKLYNQRMIKNDITYVGSKYIMIFIYLREFFDSLEIKYALTINIEVWKVIFASVIFFSICFSVIFRRKLVSI